MNYYLNCIFLLYICIYIYIIFSLFLSVLYKCIFCSVCLFDYLFTPFLLFLLLILNF
ncbi:hypothetical protein U3516DRAFT_77546 [Neocallimastix sp. 'constans']